MYRSVLEDDILSSRLPLLFSVFCGLSNLDDESSGPASSPVLVYTITPIVTLLTDYQAQNIDPLQIVSKQLTDLLKSFPNPR